MIEMLRAVENTVELHTILIVLLCAYSTLQMFVIVWLIGKVGNRV